jgi:hypothetical protein
LCSILAAQALIQSAFFLSVRCFGTYMPAAPLSLIPERVHRLARLGHGLVGSLRPVFCIGRFDGLSAMMRFTLALAATSRAVLRLWQGS